MRISDWSSDVCSSDLTQSSVVAVRNAANWTTTVNGTNSDYFTAQRWDLLEGRIFMPAEEQAGKSVCVIGNTVRTNLSRRDDTIGERISLKDVSCEIIGVLASRGQSGIGSGQDDVELLPIKTLQLPFKGDHE